jgi:hypothetical protein
MAVQFNATCKACGGEHTFCLSGAAAIDANAEYEFDCPKTHEAVRLTTDQYARVVRGCGVSSVSLREVFTLMPTVRLHAIAYARVK